MGTQIGCQNLEYALLLTMMDVMRKIGKQIKISRISRDPEISIEKLAELVGVSRQTIGNIEAGRTPGVAFLVILSIAKALGLSLKDLLHEESISAESIAEAIAIYKSSPPSAEVKKNREPGGKSTSERVLRYSNKRAG